MDVTVHARHYPLAEVAAGAALASLEVCRIPLLLEMSQVSWEEIYAVCAGYPALPVVVLNMSYTHKRSLFAGLDRFANLRFELSGYHVHRGLEEVCHAFGAERVLFGTRLPIYTAGSAIAMVQYADISPHDRALIAGDNLRALLENVGSR
jgi:predicted TIM-barrel fold metal-dependent hydrolase